MALDKNKTGIMAAITAATEGAAPVGERAHRSLPRGTIGSVRAGLGGIQEIATDLIQGWGPQDRLELTAVNSDPETGDLQDLTASIRECGQQVPVLLRPAARDGFFDVIYGRRRILACEALGIPVKALIRTLDDSAALMAKGLENAARVELSFYERARFAKAILEQGYSRHETLAALAISKNTLSQLERVARLVPDKLGEAIGAAPGAGRPKWMALATALDDKKLDPKAALTLLKALPDDMTSDMRLLAVLESLSKRGAKEHRTQERAPMPGMAVKIGQGAVSVTVKRAGLTKDFADWLDQNIDRLMMDSYQDFQKKRLEE